MLQSRHCTPSAAGVAKLADARDLKSQLADCDQVRLRVTDCFDIIIFKEKFGL